MAGETRTLAASAINQGYANPGAGAFYVPMNLTFGTTDNELNDVVEAGYLPANVRIISLVWAPTDLDTNGTPTVVHKVTVGATDIATGLTGAQTGTTNSALMANAVLAAAPVATVQKITVTTTTAAATAAIGTAVLLIHCQNA